MSRYGMPSSSSSATSRSRSDSLEDDGPRRARARALRNGGTASRLGRLVDRGGLLEVARQLQHRAGDASVGGLQGRLARPTGWRPRSGRTATGPAPRRSPRRCRRDWPAPAARCGRRWPAPWRMRCGAAAAVNAWPCGATASGELARIPACTPAQCNGTDHSTGLPERLEQRERLRQGCAAAGRPDASARRPPTARPAAAKRTGPSSIRRALPSRHTNASAPHRCRRCAGRSRSAAPPPTARRGGAAWHRPSTAASAAAAASCPSCIRTHPSSSRCRWASERTRLRCPFGCRRARPGRSRCGHAPDRRRAARPASRARRGCPARRPTPAVRR